MRFFSEAGLNAGRLTLSQATEHSSEHLGVVLVHEGSVGLKVDLENLFSLGEVLLFLGLGPMPLLVLAERENGHKAVLQQHLVV
jgi:hypothetical protein